MPSISPYRVAAFAAMAAVLLLVGWNSLRSEDAVDRVMPAGGQLTSGGTGSTDGAGAGQPGSGGAGDGGGAGGGGGLQIESGGGSGLQIGSGGRRIVVDVSGEVKRPGVYGFRHGQRVIDAIRRAGGVTEGAYPAGINRAAVLADGQQVVVPSRSAVAPAGGSGAAAAAPGAAAADAPISLGSATQAQLEEIEGIGPVTAQSILKFRDSQGGISSIDELDQVSGIGPVTMEALKSRLQP